MQIILTPNDIIQRCLWDKYVKFCLDDKSVDDITSIITNNKPISLNENDAYVIGLLRIIETDNLVHRFNEEMLDSLQIKSTIIDDQLYIKKSSIIKQVDEYLLKFPDVYIPPINYIKALEDLKNYIKIVSKHINGLETHSIKKQDIVINYFISKDVKKCLEL